MYKEKHSDGSIGLYVGSVIFLIVVLVIASHVWFAVSEITKSEYSKLTELINEYPEIGVLVNQSLEDKVITETEFAEIKIMINNIQIKRIKSKL